MKIKMNCPNCKAVMLVPGKAAGRLARCSACSGRFTIPLAPELVYDNAADWLDIPTPQDEPDDDE